MDTQWASTVVAVLGSFISGYLGVRIALTRVEERLTALAARVSVIEREIGTHETGMRGTLHSYAGVLTRHELDIENIKQRRTDQR